VELPLGDDVLISDCPQLFLKSENYSSLSFENIILIILINSLIIE